MLEVETGRWRGVRREERVCKDGIKEREKLIMPMWGGGWSGRVWKMTRVAAVLGYACRDNGVGRSAEKMWGKRFMTEA